MSTATQFEEIVKKLRQLQTKLEPPLKYEVAHMSHDIVQHIYEKVQANDRKHGCYNQNNMNTVTRKYLGNEFTRGTKIESRDLFCFNSFHESNKQLIAGIHNILTNWRLNHFKEEDIFLLRLYFYTMFMRVILLKNYKQVIRQKAPDYDQVLKDCGCPVTLSVEPDLILMSVKNNIIYQKKIEKLKILIELHRRILGLKAKKAKKQQEEKKDDNDMKQADGYVYFLEDTKSNNFKIGSTKQLKQRYKQFKTGNPDIQFYKAIKTTTKLHKKIEKASHKHFKNNHYEGEWFKITKQLIDQYLQKNAYNVIDIVQLRKEIQTKIRLFVSQLDRERARMIRDIVQKCGNNADRTNRNKLTQLEQQLQMQWKNGVNLGKNDVKQMKQTVKLMKKIDKTFDMSWKKIDDLLKEKLKYEADNKHFF